MANGAWFTVFFTTGGRLYEFSPKVCTISTRLAPPSSSLLHPNPLLDNRVQAQCPCPGLGFYFKLSFTCLLYHRWPSLQRRDMGGFAVALADLRYLTAGLLMAWLTFD
jgi:hypothetical protein